MRERGKKVWRKKDRKKAKEKLKESQIKEEYGEGEEMKINGIERCLLAGYQKRMSKRLKGRLRWKSLKNWNTLTFFMERDNKS